MELRQLKYFLTVADRRSFQSAANELFISRQAISKAISQLEEELNTELFMRNVGGAFLTPAGIQFYERVRSVVMELDQIQEEMSSYNSNFQQKVRLAFSIGTLSMYERKLQNYIRKHGNVLIKYREVAPGEGMELLKDHKTDILITTQDVRDEQLVNKILASHPYGILLKNQEELEYLDTINEDDLRWLPVACFDDDQSKALCESFGITPMYTGIDLLRLFTSAALGQCAVLVPECLVPQSITTVRWIPLQTSRKWQLYAVSPKSAKNNSLFQSAVDELMLQIFEQKNL